MYCDRTDLAVCGSTHIRAPYAGTGGNDVVHSPLFQGAAGIFPDQAGDDVQREQLAVMSMAAEIKVCACGCHFILRHVLRAALSVLSEQERQVVMLHAVTGLKHREIAQLLELPLATVLSKYRRALKKLNLLLEGDDA